MQKDFRSSKPASFWLVIACSFWCGIAPFLTARNMIGATLEITSYAVVIVSALIAAFCFFMQRGDERGHLVTGFIAGLALLMTISLPFMSNYTFFFWKQHSLSEGLRTEIILDLRKVAQASLQSGTNYLSGTRAPPESIQKLGLGGDYMGGVAKEVRSFPGDGVVSYVLFGNKLRVWGVFSGPEEVLTDFLPGCLKTRLEKNVFFFVGSKV